MGASHSSSSAAYYHNRSLLTGPASGAEGDGGRQFAREILESCDPALAEQYIVDGSLVPGSGRMMRTFRLRHKKNGSLVVVKLMWVTLDFEEDDDCQEHRTEYITECGQGDAKGTSGDDIENNTAMGSKTGVQDSETVSRSIRTKFRLLDVQQHELARVSRALRQNAHMAPFLYWKVGQEVSRPNYNTSHTGTTVAVRPALLLRPYFYTTLSDRLASRPFLTHVEKLWIVYQLLRALDHLHNNDKCDEDPLIESNCNDGDSDSRHGGRQNQKSPFVHGFLTTENIGLSSWNWVVLLDFSASYKGRTALPDDDPSEYLYYFQERQTGSGQNNASSTNGTTENHISGNPSESSEQSKALPSLSSSSPSMITANNSLANNQTREKRCYLAPERFYTPGSNIGSGETSSSNSPEEDTSSRHSPNNALTTAMDIFSAGCVIMETFLNGERAFDLGDLMEYRQRKTYTSTLQQKLNKIEFSALRAACKNMLSLDPTQRLSAREYLKRLEASGLMPSSFELLAKLTEEVTTNDESCRSRMKKDFDRESAVVTPDVRLAKVAACYPEILLRTTGVIDNEGKEYFERVLGRTAVASMKNRKDFIIDSSKTTEPSHRFDNERHGPAPILAEFKRETDQDVLFAETDALLQQLETLAIIDEDEVVSMATEEVARISKEPLQSSLSETCEDYLGQHKSNRSKLSESSLLIYLQLVLSTVRHVQRPASKLVALQLMKRIGLHSTDEARLQRIVPVTVSLLQDQDPLVRASAIKTLTSIVKMVESFPPSDSKLFPQYIFKRVAHLVTDPALLVRLAFAHSVATLAETAHRFLDISHAVQLYEACGDGPSNDSQKEIPISHNVFGDDVAKLLDDSSSSKSSDDNPKGLGRGRSSDTGASDTTRALVSSKYNTDLSALHETVSRWVIHITTDVSEHSSPVKRAILVHMARLCSFFGLDGTMVFILPQILSFLNDRKDWHLRASVFDNLNSVCQFIGRAATEHFVIPILETALVDSEEIVTSRALSCLSKLIRMGLVSRGILVGRCSKYGTSGLHGLFQKYGVLLLHPSSDIRSNLIYVINSLCDLVGPLDSEVFVVPTIRLYLQFEPSMESLVTREGMERCTLPPWTRDRFENELDNIVSGMDASNTAGQWTSIAVQINDNKGGCNEKDTRRYQGSFEIKSEDTLKTKAKTDDHTTHFRAYLRMLARSRKYAAKTVSDGDKITKDIRYSIDGSLKLVQQLNFRRQDVFGIPLLSLPQWYSNLIQSCQGQMGNMTENFAIPSVTALGQVYGLSIMGQAAEGGVTEDKQTANLAIQSLRSHKPNIMEGACRGEWGSDTFLDPNLRDTSLLLTKLNALQVPPLPPRLSEESLPTQRSPQPSRQYARDPGDPRDFQNWKPKIDHVVATSKICHEFGHTAPVVRLAVSHDQRFFVSGSQDGTCRVWESDKVEASNGVLESSLTYSMSGAHSGKNPPRVNDLVMIEGGHSVACAGSDGSVRVWRVDLVSSSPTIMNDKNKDTRRVAGSTSIKTIHPSEGEALVVNHFNKQGSSLLAYVTQKGLIHVWDLRSAKEPFCLHNFQDTGYITSMAVGSDRNWIVAGTNRGYISIWDLRFQQIMKLWHHSRSSPINRLATSFVTPPQFWVGKKSVSVDAKPYIFVASGPNECGMFDASSGKCSECFRTVEYDSRTPSSIVDSVPTLLAVSLSTSSRRKSVLAKGVRSAGLPESVFASFKSVNCMVGSTGNSDRSFLITGGSDRSIRFWDFAVPSKCSSTSGLDPLQTRPTFERIDCDNHSRLILCHQPPTPDVNEVNSSRVPRKQFQGSRSMAQGHHDAICDMKFLKDNLLSCSRDCTVKLWR